MTNTTFNIPALETKLARLEAERQEVKALARNAWDAGEPIIARLRADDANTLAKQISQVEDVLSRAYAAK